MRTIRKRVMAVCMAAMLLIPGLAVLAEEMPEAETVNRAEIPSAVSGGDTAVEMVDVETLAEAQVVYSADGIASGIDGNITWVIDAGGKLTMNGTGDLSGERWNDFYGLSEDFAWSCYRDQITSAEINVSGMADASWLFYGCENMIYVDFSSFDTSNVTNMRGLFDGCSSLLSLDVSKFDTSNVTDMSNMFSDCWSLTSLDVSKFDTSNVIDMSNMFSGCWSLTSLNVSRFDTNNVTDMASMFSGCSGLAYLEVSNFNTGNVLYMQGMFDGCDGLTVLDVSGFDTNNVTDMAHMFSGCSSLTSLDVSSFNTSNVTDMWAMFADSSFKFLDLHNFDTSSSTDMAWMFSGCNNLVSLDLSGFDTSNVTIMQGMFCGCSNLKNLNVSGFNTTNTTEMWEMFEECSSLESIDLSSFNISNVIYMEDIFGGCSSLSMLYSPCNVNISVPLPAAQGTMWFLPDGTRVTELPQGLSYSVTLSRCDTLTTPQITTTTPDLNMADVVRVKYVPYSYTVETNNIDAENTVTFSIVEGRLADGLQIYPATGEIYGVPLEAGEFKIKVMATYSNPAYLPSYAELTLTVLDNTDDNVGVATDYGYDITQPVIGFNKDVIAGENAQTLVSQGEYAQFRDVYIDGRKLTEGEEYTSAPGSTRITILNQTLANGGTGTHTLGIEFRTEDGTLKRAAQNYTISSVNTGEIPKDEDSNDYTPGNEDGNSKPSVEIPIYNGSNDADDSSNSNSLPVPIETPQQDFIIYTVERGDSLWKIAARFYGQGSSWRRIYEDNAAVIRNPGRLYVGQKLVIRLILAGQVNLMPEILVPVSDVASLTGTSYKVQKGDRLWNIAHRVYGSGRLWNIIYEANKDIIADPERIREGQVITIPQR